MHIVIYALVAYGLTVLISLLVVGLIVVISRWTRGRDAGEGGT